MDIQADNGFQKKTVCPQCQRVYDAGAPTDSSASLTPQPGHLNLCAYCGAFAVFDAELVLRKLTPEEEDAVARESGGLLKALAVTSVDEYQSRRMRHEIYKLLTGDYPEEHCQPPRRPPRDES